MSIFTPGSDAKKARAEQRGNEATAEWTKLGKKLPYLNPADYAVGADIGVPMEKTLDTPQARMDAGLQPFSASAFSKSAFGDLGGSEYGNIGPSAFDSATSAYGDLGPSAASDLGFNKENLGQMGEAQKYFGNLTRTGSDPIAEADYQRRAAQAEQSRKQNTDAALAALETKGLGNAGGQLMARTQGAQDAANARYQAGLDATANAAMRRDTAATSGASIASQMGQNQLQGDAARALAVDKYNQARAAGMDDFSAKRASGLDQFSTTVAGGKDTYNTNVAQGKDVFGTNQSNALDAFANQRYKDWYDTQRENADRNFSANQLNTQRGWQVSDANTAQKNAVPQQNFNNQMAVTSGKSNSLHGQATEIPQGATASGLGVLPQLVQMGGNIGKAVAAL